MATGNIQDVEHKTSPVRLHAWATCWIVSPSRQITSLDRYRSYLFFRPALPLHPSHALRFPWWKAKAPSPLPGKSQRAVASVAACNSGVHERKMNVFIPQVSPPGPYQSSCQCGRAHHRCAILHTRKTVAFSSAFPHASPSGRHYLPSLFTRLRSKLQWASVIKFGSPSPASRPCVRTGLPPWKNAKNAKNAKHAKMSNI